MLAVTVFTLVVNDVFAAEIKYEPNGLMLRNNPTVCSIDPKDPDLTKIQLEKISSQTRYSVGEWQQHLQEKAGKTNWSYWTINYMPIDYDKLDSTSISDCDMIVLFSKTPPSLDFWGILGLAMSDYSTGRTVIEIYYSIPELCDSGERRDEGNIIYIIQVPCYGDMMTTDQLGSVIRHEMGHGMGLGHYMSTDEQVMLDWNQGLSPTPSIMVQTSYENSDEVRIAPKDIDKLFEIYGDDGFVLNHEEEKNLKIENPYIVEQSYVDFTSKDFGFSLQYPERWWVDNSVSSFEEYTKVLYMTDVKENPFRIISVGFYNKSIIDGSTDEMIFDGLSTEDKKYCEKVLNDKNDINCENFILIESNIQNDSNGKVYSQKYIWNDGSNYHLMHTNHMIVGDKVWEITGDGLLAPSLLTQNVMDNAMNSFKLDNFDSTKDTTAVVPEHDVLDTTSPQSLGIEEEHMAKTKIPDWIRGNAKWWVQGTIGDSDFVSGIQYLIKQGIMTIPETSKAKGVSNSKEIPSWIKNNADWWAQDLISDDDFVKGIQYLIEQDIIEV